MLCQPYAKARLLVDGAVTFRGALAPAPAPAPAAAAQRQEPSADIVRRVASAGLFSSDIRKVCVQPSAHVSLPIEVEASCAEVDVADQKQTGTCWLQAGLTMLASLAKGKDPTAKEKRFSIAYLAFYDKLEKARAFLAKVQSIKRSSRTLENREFWHLVQTPIDEGGDWGMFMFLVHKYGVALEEQMPTTYQAENTSSLNYFLHQYLRSVVPDIETDGVVERALERVKEALIRTYGLPNGHLDREGLQALFSEQDFDCSALYQRTPKPFFSLVANAPNKDPHQNYISAYNNDAETPDQTIFFNVMADDLCELCLRQLRKNVPVWIVADVDHDFSAKHGIAQIGLCDVEALLDLQPSDQHRKKQRLINGNVNINHAMLLTGVREDNGSNDSAPLAWRMQNSWGAEKRGKGFITASDEWFRQHVYQAAIQTSLLQEYMLEEYPERAKFLDAAGVKLKAWDVFSTVAG